MSVRASLFYGNFFRSAAGTMHFCPIHVPVFHLDSQTFHIFISALDDGHFFHCGRGVEIQSARRITGKNGGYNRFVCKNRLFPVNVLLRSS